MRPRGAPTTDLSPRWGKQPRCISESAKALFYSSGLELLSDGIMQFSRIISPVKDLEVWSASSGGFSFVISSEHQTGPGLHGRPGFVASWRPLYLNRPAIKVGGSPFKTFADAERACESFLTHLMR